jgi:peptide/nickel transport system substrate-binding protein
VGGTIVISSGGDADAILPLYAQSTIGKQVVDALFLPLARLSDDMNTLGDGGFTPALARAWDWAPDSLSIAFHIDPRARWHDGARVTAQDVKFTVDLARDPASLSVIGANFDLVDSVSVSDSSTFVVWYKQRSPEQFYEFVYNVIPVPEHVLAKVARDSLASSEVARRPVGNGRFRFVRWIPGATIEVIADTANFLGRPRLDRLIWTANPDPTVATTKVLAGEADLIEFLRGDAIQAAAKSQIVRALERPTMEYGNLVFNFRDPKNPARPHPLLTNLDIRRAIAMAIDRVAIERNLFDTLGVVSEGPFLRRQRIAQTRQVAFDTAASARILDSLGWRDRDGDGFRDKGGHPLTLRLLAPASSTARVRASVLIQEQLRHVGVKVVLEQVEFGSFLSLSEAGNFDAVLGGWNGDPSLFALKQYWVSGPAGNLNFGHYHGAAFEALYDSARSEGEVAGATQLLERAGQRLVDDVPGVWLYETRALVAMHKRIRPAAMRADAWWANMADWSVDPAQRIDRDRIGLRSPTNQP